MTTRSVLCAPFEAPFCSAKRIAAACSLGGGSLCVSAGECVEGLFEAAAGDEVPKGGVLYDAALLDDDHPVAHGLDLLQDVRGEDDGAGLAEGFDQGADLLQLERVEA